MGYDGQRLQLRMYQLPTRQDEIEVFLGLNGSADKVGNWKEKGKYELPGNPDDYIERFFGEDSSIRPLIKKPHIRDSRLYVGTDFRKGMQFTISTSGEQAFVQIVESML